MLVDTHCHLDFPEFDSDRESVIRRALEHNIGLMINVGSDLEASKRSVELAARYENIYAAVGIHPHDADMYTTHTQAILKELSGNKKVVAIGEIGLDYFKNYSKPENQKKVFISLIKLAKELNKPLVIHTRQAENDTLGILKDNLPLRAVVHCFSGDEQFLRDCLDLGFFVSFTCNITYKKADNLRKLLKLVPLERLMLETDAPFLPPDELRGKRNEPVNVEVLASKVSQIKNADFEIVESETTNNARRFFDIE